MRRGVSHAALLAHLDGVLALASAAASVRRTHGPASVATATIPSSHASVERIQRAVEGVCFMWAPFKSCRMIDRIRTKSRA
jgi:hypothetical protein